MSGAECGHLVFIKAQLIPQYLRMSADTVRSKKLHYRII